LRKRRPKPLRRTRGSTPLHCELWLNDKLVC
jgi:hypothetical protein